MSSSNKSISEASGFNEIYWIYNCRLTRPVTRTGFAFHCNEKLLLLMKPIYEFGTFQCCPSSKINFWESKSWCSLRGDKNSVWFFKTAVESENLSFLKVYATQGRQIHASKTTLGMAAYWWERLRGWFQAYTSHRIFWWQLCLKQRNCFNPKCIPRKTWSKSSGHYIWSPTSLFN